MSQSHRKKSPVRTQQIPQPARTAPPINYLDLILPAGLALLTALAFSQIFRLGLISIDNSLYGTANVHLLQGLTSQSLAWAFRQTTNYWQPLTYVSHLIDFQLFGRNLMWHHAMSLLWHLVDTVMLYLLLRYATGAQWRSAGVAALFAIHPLHVEPVAWLASRKDVLSTFFLLLAIGAYCFWVRRPSIGRYSLLVVLFALGLMTKPSLTVLPALLLVFDFWPLGRWKAGRGLSLLKEKIPLFVLSGIIVLISLQAFQTSATVGYVAGSRSVAEALPSLDSAVSPFHYLAQLFWPAGLAIHYPYYEPSIPVALLALSALGGISYYCWKYAGPFPYLAAGWLWFLVGLAPTLGMGVGDRFAYVPSIGLFWMLWWGLADGLAPLSERGRTIGKASAVAVIAALSVCTFLHLRVWRNDSSLLHYAVDSYPNDTRSRLWLAGLLAVSAERDKALAEYQEVLRQQPYNFEALLHLACYEYGTGHVADAAPHFARALEIEPDRLDVMRALADVLVEIGRREEALRYYQAIRRLNPQNNEITDILKPYRTLRALGPAPLPPR